MRRLFGPLLASLALTFALAACGHPLAEKPPGSEAPPGAAAPQEPAACPARGAPGPIPGTRPEHETLAYWEDTLQAQVDLDAPLLTPVEIARHNLAIHDPELGYQDLRTPADPRALHDKLRERLVWLHEQLATGKYVEPNGSAPSREALAALEPPAALPPLKPSLRAALDVIPFRCAPRLEPFYKPDLDVNFDRNACSAAHPQEPIQLLADWPGPLTLARTRYTVGWIADDAPLSPPLPPDAAQAFLRGPDAVVHGAPLTLAPPLDDAPLPEHAALPAADDAHLWVATARGAQRVPRPPRGLHPTRRPLTRRDLLREAFSYLDEPYGWGGLHGGRDCSRFLMDVFGAFGLELPRFSGHQAQAGTFTLSLEGLTSERERLVLLDEAHKKGAVLLFFPGHIMLYLGRDKDGTPMAIHSFAEYLKPCPDGQGDTLIPNPDVAVTTLELGRGSARTAFLQRITHLAVLGALPGESLDGVATLRPPAPLQVPAPRDACEQGPRTTVFINPRTPNDDQPLRLIVTSYDDDAPAHLVLIDPDGKRHTPTLHRTGGPPFGYTATLPNPRRGEWTAAFGEGAHVRACRRFKVLDTPTRYGQCRTADEHPDGSGDPVWRPIDAWGPRTESLYAAFIERLFDYPLDDGRTWTNLQQLLEDPERNLLFNHLSRGEERFIKLQPDCADLPYFLRAYFAWKLGLPFGYRHCNRGRSGTPPECGELFSNLEACEGDNFIQAFNHFVRTSVGGGVHSGHGRTAPDNDFTDLYPIPLQKPFLRPGTVYADPYGHLMILTRWVPQGRGTAGVLMAADAQPDGTISRRRFWEGTFLFDPDTSKVGAGFKAFRPVRYRRDSNDLLALKNEHLTETTSFAPLSFDQYQGTRADFYDRMMGLINPRPLDPFSMLDSLVTGFHEAAQSRVISVDNGVNYMKDRPPTVEMPHGHDIFETSGPWEDFATPSRDMRLLIALDTVVHFPEVVQRNPGRFGLQPGPDLDDGIKRLREHLRESLQRRDITYTRTDGSPQRVTLQDLVERQAGLEVAYNLNDCVEVRWAAPEGSPERATCKRRANAEQQQRMQTYRAWFRSRTRPSR